MAPPTRMLRAAACALATAAAVGGALNPLHSGAPSVGVGVGAGVGADMGVGGFTGGGGSTVGGGGVSRLSLQRRLVHNATHTREYANLRRLGQRSLAARSGRLLQNEVEIYGDFRAIAYFYANVYVGSEKKKVSVITDTGSSLMAFPCSTCTSCGAHQNEPYDPSRSITSRSVACQYNGDPACSYSQHYAEGSSLKGQFYRDYVYLGNGEEDAASRDRHEQYRIDFQFGCHSEEHGMFPTQLADGIMGMGQDPKSFMYQLWAAEKLQRNVFSLCLTLYDGAMTVGAIDAALHQSPPQWAAMSHSGFYVVNAQSIAVGEEVVSTDGFGQTIVDSGTTFTYIPPTMANRLRQALIAYCNGGQGRCVGTRVDIPNEPQYALCYQIASPADLQTFPSVDFTLRGAPDGSGVTRYVKVTMAPQHVFVNMGWQRGAYCLSIYANGGTSTTLGANFMMGKDVIFDMNTEGQGVGRIGFAPSTCKFGADPQPPTPTPTQTPTPTPTQTLTPTAMPTPSPSSTGAATPQPSAEVSPSNAPPTSSAMPSPSVDTAESSPSAQPDNRGNGTIPIMPLSDAERNSVFVSGALAGVGTLVASCLLCWCFAVCCCSSRTFKLGRCSISINAPSSSTTSSGFAARKLDLSIFHRAGRGGAKYATVGDEGGDDVHNDAPAATAQPRGGRSPRRAAPPSTPGAGQAGAKTPFAKRAADAPSATERDAAIDRLAAVAGAIDEKADGSDDDADVHDDSIAINVNGKRVTV